MAVNTGDRPIIAGIVEPLHSRQIAVEQTPINREAVIGLPFVGGAVRLAALQFAIDVIRLFRSSILFSAPHGRSSRTVSQTGFGGLVRPAATGVASTVAASPLAASLIDRNLLY